MNQAHLHPTAHGARLLRQLAGLQSSEIVSAPGQYSERLGQLIDLAGSIRLATVVAASEPGGRDREPAPVARERSGEGGATAPAAAGSPAAGSPAATLIAGFLEERQSLLRWVIGSFEATAAYRRIRLPAPETAPPHDTATAFEPYRKFYSAQQREIEFRVQDLHNRVRQGISELTPRLQQLCSLDAVLGDTLREQSRQVFPVIGHVLARRFDELAASSLQAAAAPSACQWALGLDQFCKEMRDLLLAEVDARLLPVLGLIETITTETESSDYE